MNRFTNGGWWIHKALSERSCISSYTFMVEPQYNSVNAVITVKINIFTIICYLKVACPYASMRSVSSLHRKKFGKVVYKKKGFIMVNNFLQPLHA